MPEHKKKVDTWWFNLQDLMDRQVQKPPDPGDQDEEADSTPETATVKSVEERKIPVEVYMVKKMDENKTPPHSVDDVWFRVECNHKQQYGVQFFIEGPDIQLLRAEAWSRLDERFEIEWFEYYLVTVSPARIYDGQGEGLELAYKSVWKGITWEGKELLRECDRLSDYRYKIRPWPGKFTSRDGTITACIPENKITKSALEEFCSKLEKVREALEAMVTPERIMATLTGISGLKLLQASNDQVADEAKVKHERAKTKNASED